MLTKEKLKESFRVICSNEYTLEVIMDAYDCYLEEKDFKKWFTSSFDEHENSFVNEEDESLSWMVDGITTDKVLDYINSHMEYIPIVEYPEDEFLQDIIDGINDIQDFFKQEHKEDVHMMPYLFDKKACLVGSTGMNMMGNVRGLFYYTGTYNTYILEDGTVAVVEENKFSYDDKEDSTCTFRRIVSNENALLNELDDLFEEDYKGLFEV